MSLFAGLWDREKCPVVELGGQGAPCLRESPFDRFSLVPFGAGLLVGQLGGGSLALSVLLLMTRYAERSLEIRVGGAVPACPTQPSTANALADLALASIGWELGRRGRR